MRKIYTLISTLCAMVILVMPLSAAAIEPSADTTAPIIITEVMPGTRSSASEEFIELYNNTDHDIDFSELTWRLEVTSSTATSWRTLYRNISLTGILPAHQAYIIASEYTIAAQAVRYLADTAQLWFPAGLAATAGHVRLVYETYVVNNEGCVLKPSVADEVEWTGTNGGQPTAHSLDGRTIFTEQAKSINTRLSLQRIVGTAGYIDSNDDMTDFTAADPSPGAVWRPETGHSTSILPPEHACDPSASEPPQTTEPSDPPQTTPPPAGSDDPEPPENEDVTPEVTPNAGLLPAQISELLPNPAAPRTDAADEYIELYNPNDKPFVLDGYVLETGEATKHRYVFPMGSVLLPRAYAVYYIPQTGLSLSNEAGRVRLSDPRGNSIAASEPYTGAPEDKAWAFVEGRWQWTAALTPNAPNMLAVPPATVAVKKAAASTAVKKSTPAVKAANTTKTTKAAVPKTTQQQPPATLAASAGSTRRPIHPGILAAIGVFAVLYGAYEYRHDLANKFFQLRSYRMARGKARPRT